MRALILVDLQYDFMPGGSLAVARGDETVAIANRLLPHFSTVVATQDWHPQDHKSFAVNNPGSEVGQVIQIAGKSQVMWPAHCVQDTRGAELHAQLDRGKVTEVFRKGTDPAIDSYSASSTTTSRRRPDSASGCGRAGSSRSTSSGSRPISASSSPRSTRVASV